mgnify:CR=1 FL=1
MMVCSTMQDTYTASCNLPAAGDHYSTLNDLSSTLYDKLGSCYNQNQKKSTITEPFLTVQNLPSDRT